MKDRIPTKPNRYAVYDDAHNFLRYEYHERADEPTQAGDALNKATLLKDATAMLLGLTSSAVPDDAFVRLFIGADKGAVYITLYETGTTSPIAGVCVSGITDAEGGEVFTDNDGHALGFTSTETTSIRVNSEYIDLTAVPVSFSTPMKALTNATIYATRVTNTTEKEETIAATRYIRFSPAVAPVDVHVSGGGSGGGNSGGGSYYYSGGSAGKQAYATNITINPTGRYLATVGAAGTGRTASSPGTDAGASSFMGVDSSTGASGGIGGGEGTVGGSNTVAKYGTGDTNYAGGGGAGSYRYDTSPCAGGAPFGGEAGYYNTASSSGAAGQNGKGYGGGGGAGTGDSVGNSTSKKHGNGYQGAVWFKWRYVS